MYHGGAGIAENTGPGPERNLYSEDARQPGGDVLCPGICEVYNMGVQPIRKIVTPEIPDKLYFRIGDVARICEVPAYVLRFWETEFPQLKPNKGGTGQRLYRKRDVEMALRIKSLLYDQGYTIPGARQVFKSETKAREVAAAEASLPAPVTDASDIAVALAPEPATVFATGDSGADFRRSVQLRALREELRSLLAMLEVPRSSQPAVATTGATSLRPRLVLEPRAAMTRQEPARPAETLRLLVRERDQHQGDLFQGE